MIEDKAKIESILREYSCLKQLVDVRRDLLNLKDCSMRTEILSKIDNAMELKSYKDKENIFKENVATIASLNAEVDSLKRSLSDLESSFYPSTPVISESDGGGFKFATAVLVILHIIRSF
jgi:hypothetical protein